MTSYKLTLSIGYVNGNREEEITVEDMGYTEEEWDELTPEEKDLKLEAHWTDWSNNYIEGGWEKED
ncbi:MAG: hypothetical protein HOG49_39250 [Candidatus Scalindua sp.]|jgi:hypothetical protein|nr:hypothetical protein [Candidatus Scalindua sp.]